MIFGRFTASCMAPKTLGTQNGFHVIRVDGNRATALYWYPAFAGRDPRTIDGNIGRSRATDDGDHRKPAS